VEPLRLAEDRVVLRAVGTGEALKSAALHPTEAGEVVEVLFEAEQRVAKGAALLRLKDDTERLAVRLAEVAETEARRQVTRFEKLAPKGNVSAVALQTARAELESASLRLAQAEADLVDRTVFAPFDGIVGLTEVEVGDRVTEETLIATLDDRSAIQVRFTVPEEYAGRLALGDAVGLRPWTSAAQELQGRISARDSRIDPGSRSLRVKALIPTPDESIRPGTSFDVRIAFAGESYPSVPEVAVLWSRDGAYLWRVKSRAGETATGKVAEKVFVTVVRRVRGSLLVRGELAAGDLIVVEGVQGLRKGQKLEVQSFDQEQLGSLPAAAPEAAPASTP
jgi:RND family efflux transporter MFP subunit